MRNLKQDTVIGKLEFGAGGVKNVSKMRVVGGQWRLNTQGRPEVFITHNRTDIENSLFQENTSDTGSSALNGWTLGFTLPAGQSVTSSWNATLSGSSGALTARNAAHNGSIPAGGSTSFGFQGSYSGGFASPSAFTLNGSACTRA